MLNISIINAIDGTHTNTYYDVLIPKMNDMFIFTFNYPNTSGFLIRQTIWCAVTTNVDTKVWGVGQLY